MARMARSVLVLINALRITPPTFGASFSNSELRRRFPSRHRGALQRATTSQTCPVELRLGWVFGVGRDDRSGGQSPPPRTGDQRGARDRPRRRWALCRHRVFAPRLAAAPKISPAEILSINGFVTDPAGETWCTALRAVADFWSREMCEQEAARRALPVGIGEGAAPPPRGEAAMPPTAV